MSDTVFSVGLNSAGYYRELKRMTEQTDREAGRIERRLTQMERRSDRALQRSVTRTRDQYHAQMQRIAAENERANRAITDRLAREQDAARERELTEYARHHRRLEARTMMHVRRMEQMTASRNMGMTFAGGMPGLGPAASMMGMPGLGRVGSLARMGPAAGVIGAGVGTALLGANIYRDAAAKSETATAELNKARQKMPETYNAVAEDSEWWAAGVAKAAAGTKAALARFWAGAIDLTAMAMVGGDRRRILDVNDARKEENALNAQHIRRMAGRAAEASLFGTDPSQDRRRRVHGLLNEQGLRGTDEEARILARLEQLEAEEAAAAEREKRDAARRESADRAKRQADAMLLEARIAAERAGATEGLDDDRAAARQLYLARLEEARVRILSDESIPEQERHNQVMRESALLSAEYATELRKLEEFERARVERLARENAARQEAIRTFEEQLAIAEAIALNDEKRANALRAEADYARRMQEIERLGLEGERRAAAERAAATIRDAELHGRKAKSTTTIGFAGLAGGDTLMRQMMGASGNPAASTAKNTSRMVQILERMERKATVAVAG